MFLSLRKGDVGSLCVLMCKSMREESSWKALIGASIASGQADSLETPEYDETASTSTYPTGLTKGTSRLELEKGRGFYRYLRTYDVPPKRGRGKKWLRYYLEGLFSHV